MFGPGWLDVGLMYRSAGQSDLGTHAEVILDASYPFLAVVDDCNLYITLRL